MQNIIRKLHFKSPFDCAAPKLKIGFALSSFIFMYAKG